MKKNRRKKDKGVHRTPTDKNDEVAKVQVGVFSFENLMSEASEGRDQRLQFLREADVILGGSDPDHPAVFYGAEYMQEIADGKFDEAVLKKMALVGMAPEEFDQQAEELRKLIVELKGYGGAAGDVNDLMAELRFMFTQDGTVYFIVEGDQRGMVLARTREVARQYVDLVQKKEGIKLSIAEIGTVPGETLETQLALSAKGGANRAFVIRSIDGEIVTCDTIAIKAKPKQGA